MSVVLATPKLGAPQSERAHLNCRRLAVVCLFLFKKIFLSNCLLIGLASASTSMVVDVEESPRAAEAGLDQDDDDGHGGDDDNGDFGGDDGVGDIGGEQRDDDADSQPLAPPAADAAAKDDDANANARDNQFLLVEPELSLAPIDSFANDSGWCSDNEQGEADNVLELPPVALADAEQQPEPAASVVADDAAGDAAAHADDEQLVQAAAAAPVDSDARAERGHKRSRQDGDDNNDNENDNANVDDDNGSDLDRAVLRIGFVDDLDILRSWASLTRTVEPPESQDVDYFVGECLIAWLILRNAFLSMRIDTPTTALRNHDPDFLKTIPDDHTLLYVASHQAVHIGVVVKTSELEKVTTLLRHHLNVREVSQHFTKPLRLDKGSETASTPSVPTIGNREVLFVSARTIHAALSAAGITRIRVWSIGAKIKLDFAVANLKLDLSEDVKALEWRNIYIDIATVHYHDPRPLSGDFQEVALASGDSGTGAVVREQGLDQLIPLFRAGLFRSKAKSLDEGRLGKTRVACHTNEFSDFAHLEQNAQGNLTFKPGLSRDRVAGDKELHLKKGNLYQVATGYSRSASSARGRIGKGSESVRQGLRSLKSELLPALREYAIGGFRSETRFFYSKWSDFVAAGGVDGLARTVSSLELFLHAWKIDVSEIDLDATSGDDCYVKLVDQQQLLELFERRCDWSLEAGVSQLEKRRNCALQQRARLRDLLSLAGVDTKWNHNLLNRRTTWNFRDVCDEEVNRSSAKKSKVNFSSGVLNSPELANQLIAEAKDKIKKIVDDPGKRRWIEDAFELVRMGGHKTGYSIRCGPPKGGMFCAGDDVASTLMRLYDLYLEWRDRPNHKAMSAKDWLNLRKIKLRAEGSPIIIDVSKAQLARL